MDAGIDKDNENDDTEVEKIFLVIVKEWMRRDSLT